jgi:hypothetical protein
VVRLADREGLHAVCRRGHWPRRVGYFRRRQVRVGRQLFPITDHASEIEGIMKPAMDEILAGKTPVTSLNGANNQVNQLFG